MDRGTIVKCYALLCRIRGELMHDRRFDPVLAELNKLIDILESYLGSDQGKGDNGKIARMALLEVVEWIRVFFS